MSNRDDTNQSFPTQRVSCDHCRLPVPSGLIEPGAPHQFCCNGCKSVFNVLKGAGLDGYYQVRDAIDPIDQPAKTTTNAYEEFDDPSFERTCVENLPGGLAQTELLLEGMHCAACVWLIERLPRVLPGIIESRANIRTRTATIRYQPDQVLRSQIAKSLDRLGYTPHPARGASARQARVKEDRKFLIRVGVAGAIAGNVMLLAIALYGGALNGITQEWENTFRYYSMGLAILSLIWPGRVFFIGALAALRTRTAHLDIPIALALAVGGLWGSYNTLMGTGEVYFDSISVLVFFLLVGRWIQHRQQRAASDDVELMLTLTPTSALKVNDDGSTTRVPIDAIEAGMLVSVSAGSSIPTDGTIESGATSLDNALITGESFPIAAQVGDQVIAGATNLQSPITVRVSAVGDSTRAGKLMKLVASATSEKAPIVLFADRIAARFVIAVIVLACITFAYWTITSSLHTGIEFATALLIVTCPCALGLATPMSMSIAMGRAAKHGILVKSASAIESMSISARHPASMILDKTGTITQATMSIVDTRCDEDLLQFAAVIETHANHPIARAFASVLDNDSTLIATDIDQSIGAGISGTVNAHRVSIGSPAFIESITPIDATTQSNINAMLDQSLTPVVIHAQGHALGVIGIGDPIRPDALSSIALLKAAHFNLQVCSGDHPDIVSKVAHQVGIESAIGAVSPEGKAQFVRDLQAKTNQRVIMVGDGVNDSAALASAEVGIAVHGGAEASLQAADIYLTKQGVAPLVTLVALASHTMRTIHISLVFSICYNAIAAGLAMSGMISALLAAILMPISSLTVVAMSTRKFNPPKMNHNEESASCL